uniref:Si:ch73-54n14.2 n=1 Tax=Sphaeramia orbicularis TaxID=375764 RepID=A0A673B5Z0_9TELE
MFARCTHLLVKSTDLHFFPTFFSGLLSLSFSQVLCQKQVDSPEVKQVSVRRFATFDLFHRIKLMTEDPSNTSDDQWVEYRSVSFPKYSALLRDNLGPLRVNEVLNSFDNTGNVLCMSRDGAQW